MQGLSGSLWVYLIMGYLFFLTGRSASGKDSVLHELKERFSGVLRPVVLHTTRPMREGEIQGVTYYFVSDPEMDALASSDGLIHMDTYHVNGGHTWRYATTSSGIDLSRASYLTLGPLTLLSDYYRAFGRDRVVPVYIYVDEGELLFRAVMRERQQKSPRFSEVCRRFLADDADFSEEKLSEADIGYRFENRSLPECADRISDVIRSHIGNG